MKVTKKTQLHIAISSALLVSFAAQAGDTAATNRQVVAPATGSQTAQPVYQQNTATVQAAPVVQVQAPAASTFRPNHYVEVSGNYSDVNSVNPAYSDADYQGLSVYAATQPDPNNVWFGTVATQEQFGQQGTFASVGNRHTWNQNTYTSISVGGGDDLPFPDARVDASVSQVLGANRNVTATLGAGVADYDFDLREKYVHLGADYGVPNQPLTLSGGMIHTITDPGDLDADRYYVAGTYGKRGVRQVTLRHDFGETASPSDFVAGGNFKSDIRGTSLSLRQWLSPTHGVVAAVEHFDRDAEANTSDDYDRTGVRLGFFKAF